MTDKSVISLVRLRRKLDLHLKTLQKDLDDGWENFRATKEGYAGLLGKSVFMMGYRDAICTVREAIYEARHKARGKKNA